MNKIKGEPTHERLYLLLMQYWI